MAIHLYVNNNLYSRGVNYLKDKAMNFLRVCENQIQNTIAVVYPILRHPRQSTIYGLLSSTRYVANLTKLGFLHEKACYILSKRSGRVASIEYQVLLKLRELSSYCIQLGIDPISWQKFPETQTLDHLKQQLQQSLQQQHKTRSIEQITKALSCCNEIYMLASLHYSAKTSELNSEELQILQENTTINSVLSAIEENTGEILGGYAPQILGPAFNDLFNIIPDSYNPLLSISNSLVNTLKKLLIITTGTSTLAITSTNYFTSPATARALLQASSTLGTLTAALW